MLKFCVLENCCLANTKPKKWAIVMRLISLEPAFVELQFIDDFILDD